MDLTLDSKQNRALDCSTCDPQKMIIRNCNNQFGQSKSPILINNKVYRVCPRSIVANDWELGYFVSLYFDCRNKKQAPFGGTLANTTAFCKELFDILDSMKLDYEEREQKKLEEERKKELAKSKGKR